MSLLLTIHSAHSGLKVASQGINVVGHNTANATSEGYTRRTLVATSSHPLQRDGHWLGQGTRTRYFQRHSDHFVERQIVKTHAKQSQAQSAYEAIRLLESRLNDGQANSIVETYNRFIDSMRQLSNDPGDNVFRSQLIDDAEDFTESVRNAGSFSEDRQLSIREEVEFSISEVNSVFQSIAEHNKRIRRESITMTNSDLMDQRDRLIAKLSEQIGVDVHYRSDGQATVFFDGHPVVQESYARTFSYSEDAADRPVISLSSNSGTIDVTDGLQGSLGGKLEAYDTAQDFLDDLSTFVIDFSVDFNTQHASGYDQSGNAGGDFFSVNSISPVTSFSLDSSLAADSTLIAAASVSTAEYGDRGNLDQLLAIDDVSMFNSGAFTPREFLTHIYSNLAENTAAAENDYELYSVQMDDMFELRNSIAGVDLDQEAMKLMEYQASYEAAARVLTVSNQLLGELMNMV
jgi:flagellar hook-associated protein 1 FlgK